jgi:capsular polysaccharide export protein
MVWASSQTEISNSTVRLEDGFLRSNGLGAKLTPPMSLVTDETGIYYDPRHPSQLEHMIATSDTLRPDQRHRAARLQQRLITLGLSKYNVGQTAAEPGLARPNTTASTLVDQRRILVPRQVEDDASIRTAAGTINANLALLRAVRRQTPMRS